MNLERLSCNPIIVPDMDARMGSNINGPSLIRVPDWVANPLGRYYLYFAHHQGTYIRMAYADRVEGPWQIHTPGVLDLEDSHFQGHIASPDVHVLEESREIRMYYHGPVRELGGQFTRLAISADGLNFQARPEVLGKYYWRVFRHGGMWYSIEKPPLLRRSPTGLGEFEEGPQLLPDATRHTAVHVEGDLLRIYYTAIGDCPEAIRLATVRLDRDWREWEAVDQGVVLEPGEPYEGIECPLEPSKGGAVHQPVRQLRDPCFFEEGAKRYLLYSVAGENGIAIASLNE
ncbi:MAG TPA: hypothetical protein VNQ90_09080 [Chthoniobacteraceae bacterium]|nr:hypothetical protein [Chthoniobacteraceae bacterium]